MKINLQRTAAKMEERNQGNKNQSEINMMALLNTYLSIITLNVTGFSSPAKGIEWMDGLKTKQNKCSTALLPTRDSLQF